MASRIETGLASIFEVSTNTSSGQQLRDIVARAEKVNAVVEPKLRGDTLQFGAADRRRSRGSEPAGYERRHPCCEPRKNNLVLPPDQQRPRFPPTGRRRVDRQRSPHVEAIHRGMKTLGIDAVGNRPRTLAAGKRSCSTRWRPWAAATPIKAVGPAGQEWEAIRAGRSNPASRSSEVRRARPGRQHAARPGVPRTSCRRRRRSRPRRCVVLKQRGQPERVLRSYLWRIKS